MHVFYTKVKYNFVCLFHSGIFHSRFLCNWAKCRLHTCSFSIFTFIREYLSKETEEITYFHAVFKRLCESVFLKQTWMSNMVSVEWKSSYTYGAVGWCVNYSWVKANSHMPCCAPAVPRQCRVLRESPSVAGKIRTANRDTPRIVGWNRTWADCPQTVEGQPMSIHMYHAVLCCGLDKSLAKRQRRSTVGSRHAMRESNSFALWCTNGKDTI
jgi:hypothetical protein